MKMEITDDQAIDSFIWFSMNHRAAIADWAAKQFDVVESQGDKLSLAIEVFEKFIASVEDLEMLYFALRETAQNPAESFLSLYAKVFVKEEGKTGKQMADSAGEILRQISYMGIDQFRQSLGLPTENEYHKVFRQGRGTLGEASAEYRKLTQHHLEGIRQSVQNRSTPELMQTYNKIKHGFVVIVLPDGQAAFMVREVEPIDGRTSLMDGSPYAPTTESLGALVSNIKTVAQLTRELLMLHFRRLG
jgi:hypothetical protein